MNPGVQSSVESAFKRFGVAGVLESAGVIMFLAGVVQLLHHAAIAVCVIGGVGAFLVGKKLRTAN